ncbi:MAG: MFS transporter [Candidatus Omnitrophica bacterium]|nr:MFS transporter [Candidatus Omnitrophota bacterium]
MPKISFYIFCAMFFVISFGVSAMAALIPSIAIYFGIAKAQALPLTWLYMLPYGVFALIWAPFTRIVKVRKILLIATLGFFLSSLWFSLSKSIEQAFISRFLMGCFGCSFVPVILITIGKVISSKDKAKSIGVFFAFSYFSNFISVFLSGFFENLPLGLYLIPSILSLLVFILVLTRLEDFDFRVDKFKISYLDTLKDKKAVNFFIVVMLGSLLYHGLQQRLGIYLSERFSLEQITISSIFTVSILAAMIFEFSGGFLSARFGNIKVSSIGFFLMSVFAFSLIFIGNYKLIFLMVTLWGAGMALTHVGLASHLTLFPDRILRDASSLNSALRFSFGGLGAFLGGLLVSIAGFKALFIIICLSILFLGLNLKKIIK